MKIETVKIDHTLIIGNYVLKMRGGKNKLMS